MAPRTRKPVAKRRSNHVSRDEDGVEEHGQEPNEQELELEVGQQPIQKRVTTRSTRSATASRTVRSGILDKLQMMENQQQLRPQVFPQASMEKVTGSRTRGATGNQSGYHRLEELDQMDGDGQLQNGEEDEIRNEEEHRNQETAPRSQRSTVSRRLNHDYLEEDEMEEYGQQDNEQYTNLEVTDALKNVLQILMASGSQRATTNQNHGAFQDNHQRRENGNWKNRRLVRPPISEQASVMAPTIRKATGSHFGYHRLQDEIQMEVDGQHQYEEQPDLQMTRQVMTSSTRRSTGKRKINQRLLDRDEIEEHGQQGNEQPNMEYTQEVERALKILMAPSTRKAITTLTSRSGFRENNLIKENGQPENRKQLQPQNGHQASVMPSRTWKATTNQSGCHRLRDKDQIERHREHQNEEQSEFLTTQLTKDKREEHGQRENKQASDVEVTQAIENALKILMEPSTRRATTNETSHHGFQDITQEASISAVMPPRSQNATRNQSGFHRLEDEDQMEGDEEQQNGESPEMQKAQQANNEKGTVKRVRGPTLLREIWGRNSDDERIKVTFNKRGQPVGPNRLKFTGFLGTLARNGKYAPLDIDDWRKVPKENKDEMIKFVKERFEIPEGAEHWILLSIGRKRSQWKSRVKIQCFDPTLPKDNQTPKPPPRVNEEQLKKLMSYWAKEDVMEECERNKISSQRSVLHQTTGKLSFAELEEELKERLGRSPTRVEMFAACFTHRDGNPSTHEAGVALARMREKQSNLPQGSEDPVQPNHSFAKVIGHDPLGKPRFGFGAKGDTPSRGACLQMISESQAAMRRMEERMDQFSKIIERFQPEKMQPEQNQNDVPPTRTPISPNQSSNSNIVGYKLQVGDSVCLKSLFDPKKIVAKGCLETVDPDEYVGGRRLGSNWYGVQISVPIEWDEDLIRPFSNFSTIGEAVGNRVAWPHHLVTDK
ncbi:uncharacterized protein LOC121807934 isoform X1 [Salvia splendens]|uniref:uncharacterized protein LOC121807934 isoform X1 n=2 Tax=Salvia splendens TaxID=180675 RepID=UPI001C265573|nr:uncharacterized protein LOC121807934 isoform X1 [Salvia splendens]XP_042064210.1 uncharacterized protein LOC121807934 isoform X1 [Salvia splendens]